MRKVLFLLGILAVQLSSAAPAAARVIDRTAALVNGEVITLSDVNRFRQNFALRKEIDPFVGFFNAHPESTPDIITYLSQEALITQKFPATRADIDEEVQSVLKKNSIELDQLKAVLKNQNVNFAAYEHMMGISLSKRKLLDRELRPLAVVTDDEVRNYYYTDPSFLARKKQAKFLLSYDLSQMRVEGKELANEITEKLKTGEDFDAVARRYSDRGVRAASLGSLREDSLADSIRASLESLKVGEVTKPVLLGENLYVIHRVNAVSAPHDPIFEKEKPGIQNKLYMRAMERQLSLWTEREKQNAFVYVPAE